MGRTDIFDEVKTAQDLGYPEVYLFPEARVPGRLPVPQLDIVSIINYRPAYLQNYTFLLELQEH